MRVAGEAPKTRITFAVEFNWRDEWPEGESELIVARVILNLRQQFSLRPDVSRGNTFVPFSLSSFTPFDSPLFRFCARGDRCRHRTIEPILFYGGGNILPISLTMQISIRERHYLQNRAEKGF